MADQPRASTSYRVNEPSVSRADLAKALRVALDALAIAPHKTRFDFQPYWDWYDGDRTRAIDQANRLLNEFVK
jgi:hypothetical protein